MRNAIGVMTLVTIGALVGSVELFKLVPVPVSNTVIAEKSDKALGGGQAAMKVPDNLTSKQHQLLNIAYRIGKEDGHPNPEVVQQILLQETLAGGLKSYRVANEGPEAYFGPMQLKLAAARDVLKKFPALFTKYEFHTKSDDEIKANLILNEDFNIEVGSKYLRILEVTYGFKGKRLLNAYNRGAGGVASVGDDYHYAIGAQQKFAQLSRN